MNKYERLSLLETQKNEGKISDAEYEAKKFEIMNDKGSDNLYTASLILGICAFFFGGLILSIVGLVISIKAMNKKKENGDDDSKSTAGLVLSIVALVKSIIVGLIVFFGIMISITANNSLYESARNASDRYNRSYYNSYYDYDYDYDYDDDDYDYYSDYYNSVLKNYSSSYYNYYNY